MPPPAPTPTPTPPSLMNKSIRNRMGTVMRRTSSVLTFARPATPSRSSSDSGSIKHLDISPPVVDQSQSHPSPIAESPAREAASQDALPTEPLGPSPLAETTSAPTPSPSPPAAAKIPSTSASEGQAETEEPPRQRVFASSAGPGAFTDEPEEMTLPQPQVIVEPSVEPSTVAEPSSQIDDDTHAQAEETIPQDPMPEPPLTVADGATSYFDLPPSHTIVPPQVESHPVYQDPATNVWAGEETTPRPPLLQSNDNVDDSIPPVAVPVPVTSTEPNYGGFGDEMTMPSYPQAQTQDQISSNPEPSKESLHADPDQSKVITQSNEDVKHEDIQMPVEDPFADPDPVGPITYQPQTSQEQESTTESYGTVVMPLPDIHDVIPSRPIRTIPSAQSIPFTDPGQHEHEHEQMERDTDERRPLLSRPHTPPGGRMLSSYLQPSTANHVAVSAQSGGGYSGSANGRQPNNSATPRFHALGWIEYVLPDASFYYVHPTLRVTTDIDLRRVKKLEAITSYFDHKDSGAPVGLEMWLRDGDGDGDGKAKGRGQNFVPVVHWVDHKKRTVTFDPSYSGHSNARGSVAIAIGDDDRLDMEFRYWSFMESHPAHTSLPSNAANEAMDALTWSYTDRLLPSTRHIPSPFSQEECQELMNLLRSFGNPSSETGIQPIVHTRIVSRILIRIAQWRQTYFRPNKPLPRDTTLDNINHRRRPRMPFRRVILDLLISCVCLGIPYIFMTRARHHRIDEEGGLRGAAPMLVAGACTCLVAAIVLSASVTFLSLPGLDTIARVSSFVAILGSIASMASSVIALLRFKADMDIERPTPTLTGEGMMLLSRQSIAMSLPLVLLAYAIIAFITGVVFYSFRGITFKDPSLLVQHFENYTKWTVVGVLGGLAGMLTTSALLLRR